MSSYLLHVLHSNNDSRVAKAAGDGMGAIMTPVYGRQMMSFGESVDDDVICQVNRHTPHCSRLPSSCRRSLYYGISR